MSLLNRFGFLVFGNTPPEPFDLLELPTGGAFGPTTSSIIFVPGESYLFYLAFDSPVTLNDGNIGFVRDNSTNQVLTNIGTLEDVVINVSGDRHSIARITVPSGASAYPAGYYRLVIHGTTTNYYSNRVWLNASGFQDFSALWSFRNNRPVGPIAYDVANMLTVRQSVRLKCFLAPTTKSNTTTEEYNEVTTGRVAVVETKTNAFLPFIAKEVDIFGHEGFRTMLDHHDIKVNGLPVELKDPYTESNDTVGNATFSVWDNRYSIINRC